MTIQINKDTTLCMSLAARPSNFGTRFHNYLYQALSCDFIYKAFPPQILPPRQQACTPDTTNQNFYFHPSTHPINSKHIPAWNGPTV